MLPVCLGSGAGFALPGAPMPRRHGVGELSSDPVEILCAVTLDPWWGGDPTPYPGSKPQVLTAPPLDVIEPSQRLKWERKGHMPLRENEQ